MKNRERPPVKAITPEVTKYTQGDAGIHESVLTDARNLRARSTQKFNYDNPCLILTAGPTGSGKSDLTRIALELLYSSKSMPRCKKFLVDDLVENSDLYKKKIDDIIVKFGCDKSTYEGECDLKNPSPALLNHFEEAYMSTRKVGPCTSTMPESCNHIFKSRIKTAIEENKNISIETTGSKIPLEYVNLVDTKKYNVVFVYSLVNFVALLGRNTDRASRNMTSYLKDRTKPGPRLPDVSEKTFKNATSAIIQTIIKLRNICLRLGRPSASTCGSISSGSAFTLLIFDNDGPSKQLVYNSRTSNQYITDSEFITFISRYKLDVPHINSNKSETKTKTKTKTKNSKNSKNSNKSNGGGRKQTKKNKHKK